MINRLEDLPNEILWIIIEYIPAMDLFHTFYNLNQRFNIILRLIHYRFNLLYTNKNQFNYFLDQILDNIEINYIESFYIDDISSRLNVINKFQNLISLTIYHLRTKNLGLLANSVLPKLIQLNSLRLYSEFTLKDSDINSLTNVIFSNQMSSLVYCYLAFQDFGQMTFNHLNINDKNISLKHLIIDQWCRLKDFVQLLYFIPNIQYLTVRLFDLNTKVYQISIDDYSILVPHLIYLRAKISQISFSNATKILFLRLPSTLKELSLSTWSIEYNDGEAWENLLSTKFPHLKHFRLIISLDSFPRHLLNNNLDDFIKTFNQSKYFLDHNWKVLINVNELDRLKFVLHTIKYPIENFQTTLYNIRRSTLSPTILKSTYSGVKKLSLTLHNDVRNDSVESRYFPNVDQLIFLSNLTNDSLRFNSLEYFNNLKNLINFSNITSLKFSEETHQYPIELINLLLQNSPNLISLTLSYRLYISIKTQITTSLKTLTLIFATHSSTSPPPSNQILTNQLILEFIQIFSSIQTLTLIVRDLDGFDSEFSEWLKENIFISYDLLLIDKIVRFYF